MGRAFRVVKRTAHLTVQVTEKPPPVMAAAETAERGRRGAKRARGAKPKARLSEGHGAEDAGANGRRRRALRRKTTAREENCKELIAELSD